MQLDYGSNDIMRMTVNFTYRYFSQVWGDVEKTGGPNIIGAQGEEDTRKWDEFGDDIG